MPVDVLYRVCVGRKQWRRNTVYSIIRQYIIQTSFLFFHQTNHYIHRHFTHWFISIQSNFSFKKYKKYTQSNPVAISTLFYSLITVTYGKLVEQTLVDNPPIPTNPAPDDPVSKVSGGGASWLSRGDGGASWLTIGDFTVTMTFCPSSIYVFIYQRKKTWERII